MSYNNISNLDKLRIIRANVTLMGDILKGTIEADVVDEITPEMLNHAELSIQPTLALLDQLILQTSLKG